MCYETPEMWVIDFKEDIMTVVIVSGDVKEDGNLPNIDLSGAD